MVNILIYFFLPEIINDSTLLGSALSTAPSCFYLTSSFYTKVQHMLVHTELLISTIIFICIYDKRFQMHMHDDDDSDNNN